MFSVTLPSLFVILLVITAENNKGLASATGAVLSPSDQQLVDLQNNSMLDFYHNMTAWGLDTNSTFLVSTDGLTITGTFENPCTWNGIICDVNNTFILQVQWGGAWGDGGATLPTSTNGINMRIFEICFVNLPKLNYIDLSGNGIIGTHIYIIYITYSY
jgi:hypothetical protein